MFKRYAVFYTPQGTLADWGAKWLGWDSRSGTRPQQPVIAGIDLNALTQRPQKYGFHGTLKAPFRLAVRANQAQLEHTAREFARRQSPFKIGQMTLRHQNGFVALRPMNEPQNLRRFAAEVVKAFDPHRADLTDTELTRRRKSRLSARQDQQLLDWGYPFIFEDFHFHLTLSGRVPQDTANLLIDALTPVLAPLMAATFKVDAITLMGEDESGMFHQIQRYMLHQHQTG